MFWVGPSCDNWNFNASNPCLYVGGNYGQNGNYGLFYVNYNTASNTSSNIGSRHLSASLRPSQPGRVGLANHPQLFTAQIIAHPTVKISYKGAGEYPPGNRRGEKARTAKRRSTNPYAQGRTPV